MRVPAGRPPASLLPTLGLSAAPQLLLVEPPCLHGATDCCATLETQRAEHSQQHSAMPACNSTSRHPQPPSALPPELPPLLPPAPLLPPTFLAALLPCCFFTTTSPRVLFSRRQEGTVPGGAEAAGAGGVRRAVPALLLPVLAVLTGLKDRPGGSPPAPSPPPAPATTIRLRLDFLVAREGRGETDLAWGTAAGGC